MTTSDDDALLRRAADPTFIRQLGERWHAARDADETLGDVAAELGVPAEFMIGFAAGRASRSVEPDSVALDTEGRLLIHSADETLAVPMDANSLHDLGGAMQALAGRLTRGDMGH